MLASGRQIACNTLVILTISNKLQLENSYVKSISANRNKKK